LTQANSIDGRQLFEKFSQQEPIPEVSREMILFICEHIEGVLGEIMNSPFTLASYSEAKLAYCKWMLDDAEFNDKFGTLIDDSTMGLWRGLYSQMIGQLENIVDNPEAFQKETGMTDQILINKLKFNEEAQALVQKGQLTVGALLMAQPKIILDNTGR
jgi:hypothetical protein